MPLPAPGMEDSFTSRRKFASTRDGMWDGGERERVSRDNGRPSLLAREGELSSILKGCFGGGRLRKGGLVEGEGVFFF